MARRRSGTRLCSKEYRLAMYLRDRCRCQYCGRAVVIGAPVSQSNAATLDHVVPVAADGSNSYTNLVTVCAFCNSSRQDKTPRQWYAVLRDRGIDTALVSQRVRRAMDKNIAPYLAMARAVIRRENKARAAVALFTAFAALA